MSRELFDPAFLRLLEGLHMQATRVPAHGRHAEQRSKQRGAGAEFTDVYDPYVPGDDFRAIDWHVYQRMDRLFLRLYLEEQDLPVYCLLDQSTSMAQPGPDGAPSKSVLARQAVAALAYLTLHHMDRFWVLPFATKPLRPLRALAGKNALHRLLAYLNELPAAGDTGMVEAIKSLAHRRYRRGLCVVISDFYDRRGIEPVLRSLGQLPHRLLLLRPVHAGEQEPAQPGEHLVVDCETGEQMAISVDEALRKRYRQAYDEFETGILDFARRRHTGLLTLRSDRPVPQQIVDLFPGGVMRV